MQTKTKEAATTQNGESVQTDAAPAQPQPRTTQDRSTVGEDPALSILAQHRATSGSTFGGRGENLLGKDAFSVSIFPDITKVVEGALGLDHIVEFLQKNAALLSQAHVAVGTWEKDGHIDLDVVVLTNDLVLARRLGKQYNQKCIFDLLKAREIPTGGTGEAPNDLPPAPERLVEVSDAPRVHLVGRTKIFNELTEKKFASESAVPLLPRTYWMVQNRERKMMQSSAWINGGRYYQVDRDPEGIFAKWGEGAGLVKAEFQLKDAGYSGYRDSDFVVSFDAVQAQVDSALDEGEQQRATQSIREA
ncbi:MAG TPA: hypothetical protein VJP02_26920 [Candidatus Sulfotelmatobacter sp.]|nr:hypothetical protein [Candidatus Sulfotelmatobacter sp.]